MPRRSRSGGRSTDGRRGATASRTPTGSPGPATRFPEGPVEISTGTVEVHRHPQQPSAVTVLVNGVPSSHLDLDDPTRLEFEYMQQMAAAIDQLPAGPLDAVHLGAAACALPRWLEAVRPGSRQVAVELDAELARLVRTWFDLPRSPRLRLRVREARDAVAEMRTASADVLVRDVFAPDVTPAHLATAEFLAEVARVLRPGGLYLANCADRPPLSLARAEVATAREVFADVALAAEPAQLKGRHYGNLVVMATTVLRRDGGGMVDRSGGDDTDRDPPVVDLGSPALARTLRSLPVPVRLLHGADLTAFAGPAAVLRDAPTRGPADPDTRLTDHPNGGATGPRDATRPRPALGDAAS